jgi:hypothetical protein
MHDPRCRALCSAFHISEITETVSREEAAWSGSSTMTDIDHDSCPPSRCSPAKPASPERTISTANRGHGEGSRKFATSKVIPSGVWSLTSRKLARVISVTLDCEGKTGSGGSAGTTVQLAGPPFTIGLPANNRPSKRFWRAFQICGPADCGLFGIPVSIRFGSPACHAYFANIWLSDSWGRRGRLRESVKSKSSCILTSNPLRSPASVSGVGHAPQSS